MKFILEIVKDEEEETELALEEYPVLALDEFKEEYSLLNDDYISE